MIFNLWRPFPRFKPKINGNYLCVVAHISDVDSDKVYYLLKILNYKDHHGGKWVNVDRQSVFDGYKVYKCCRATIEENHVYSDGPCEPDVIFWKELPKVKKKGK